jgi:DNA-binding SARP family transcriptional activator
MEVRLLGPLELEEGGQRIQCTGPRQRAVLALLALYPDQVMPSERLVEELWGEQAPPSAANDLQQTISRLRRVLPPGRLVTQPPGYLLRAAPDELDVGRFERLLVSGHQALANGAADEAAQTLRQALGLWRGPALADFRFEPFAQAEIVRLEELHLTCVEERVDADLARGAAAELVAELQRLVTEQPLRERLCGQLMLALYRAGRQVQALETYRELRTRLVEELGLEPGPALRELEAAILRHDPMLQAMQPPPAAPAPVRKPLTVLCVELGVATESSTSLDPEAQQIVLARALSVLTAALERHGGKLTAAAGTQILGVFGIPALHEDDALRAARAALAGRDGLDAEAAVLAREHGLRLTARCGIATGETLISGPDPPSFVGDPAAHAAALASSAGPGEILLDEVTHQLAVAALEVTSVGPGRLRLHAVRMGERPLPLRLDAPLVGRDWELDRLAKAFTRATRGTAPVLVTVLGEPGIGKTRLAHELAVRLATQATVLSGRCLPYGEGITFWPLRELVRQAGAHQNHREELAALLHDNADAELIADRLAGALGDRQQEALAPAEIFWATRRLLEILARRRPLLVIVEDVHWAEPTFLDLVESVATHTRAPMLLVCLTRPELVEQRPAWAGDAKCAVTLTLEPLAQNAATALLDALTPTSALAPTARKRLLEIADGNPLFLEQLAASLSEQRWGEGGPALPPRIDTLLKARVERLGPAERMVLERAAVLGRDFWLDAVAALLPEQARAPLHRHLQALVVKGLVQPVATRIGSSEDFRFRHILIQQAAYGLMAKSLRADLHKQFAHWLERRTDTRVGEYDEILGYHLEQAVSYQRELALTNAQEPALARRAASHLEAAGNSAHARGDVLAAVNLLKRAAALLPQADSTLPQLLTSLGAAMAEAGQLDQADDALSAAQRLATGAGDDGLEAHARVERLLLGLQLDLNRATAEAGRVLPDVLQVFERDTDQHGLCRVWRLQAAVHWNKGNSAAAEDAWQRAAAHARRTGDRRQLVEILGWLASAALWGPTPAPEGIWRCQACLIEVGSHQTGEAMILLHLAGLYAMQNRIPDARALLARRKAILDDLGETMTASITQPAAFIAMLTGDAADAERHLRLDYARLERMGERGFLAMTAALLAQAIVAQEQERSDEAERFIAISQGASEGGDVAAQIVTQGVLARILATRKRFAEAEALARNAVALAEQTDLLNQHGDALLDLAAVLDAAGRTREGQAAVSQALLLYWRKGNLLTAEDARRRLERSALE